jgi:hypothetical protein
MKIANIIIAHKNPGQLLKLVNQFSAGHFHNFVHLDARADITQFNDIVSHPAVTMLPRVKVNWAANSFLGVIIDSVKQVLSSNGGYSYINLMSGMDFPIRSTEEFHDFLEEAYKKGPIEFFDILDLDQWPGAHRYERIHFNEWTIKGRYFVERIVNSFIPKRKFWGGRMVPYGYSTWFTASDQFMTYALKFFEENPGYIRFLKTCWCPDEFIFNSLVMNSPFKDKVEQQTVRYIDWSEGKVHPKLFKSDDVNKLLSSGRFIARKFDQSVDKNVLDELEISNLKSQISN